MAYIGKTPVLGNFVKLDAISVVNGQAAYTMQNGGVNFTSYDNVNQFLVSLNGILQSPTDSFTVSGSTLTFASNLSTGDVIDFVMVLGNTLDIGTPSDNTVSLAKLTATGTKDATTFLRGDNTFAEAGGGAFEKISTTDLGDGSTASVQFNTLSTDYVDFRVVVTGLETVTNSEVFGMYVKRAGQGSFDTGSNNYLWANHGMRSDGEISAGNTGDTILKLHSSTLASQSGVDGASNNFIIDIFNPHDTWNKKFIGVQSTFTDGTYGRAAAQTGSGYRNSKEAIIGVEFVMTAGNMSRGIFTLYGRKQ